MEVSELITRERCVRFILPVANAHTILEINRVGYYHMQIVENDAP